MVEFIGFFISLIALLFLFFRGRSLEKYRREHPEAFGDEKEEENILIPILQEVNREEEEKEKFFSPKRIQDRGQQDEKPFSKIEKRHLVSNVEKRHLKSELEQRRLKNGLEGRQLATRLSQDKTLHLENIQKLDEPRIVQKLKALSHLKDLVIYQAIVGKPKGLE